MYTVKATYAGGEGIAVEHPDLDTLAEAVETAQAMKLAAMEHGFRVEGDVRRDRRYVCTDANRKSFRIWIEKGVA